MLSENDVLKHKLCYNAIYDIYKFVFNFNYKIEIDGSNVFLSTAHKYNKNSKYKLTSCGWEYI